MATVVEILASVLTSGIGVALFIVFSIRRRVHRSNRLVAGRRSGAPASWIWSPRRAAVLHRRLQSCCQLALQATAITAAPSTAGGRRPRGLPFARRRRASAPGPFERLAADVIAQAVELDARLVAVDRRTGYWRRQALAELSADVRELEASARRMETLAHSWRAQLSGPEPVSPALGERLDALEATMGELRVPTPTPPTAPSAPSAPAAPTGPAHRDG